jgi:hypothetical protein
MTMFQGRQGRLFANPRAARYDFPLFPKLAFFWSPTSHFCNLSIGNYGAA